jgi:DNA-binding winged helix-turn-helix (wHTH) protein
MRSIFGDYELDEQLYEVRRAGELLKLARKVFDVLAYLLHHRERLVPKEALLEKLWPGQVVGEAALTRCITAARKALGDDGNRQEIIKTQHGRGYRLIAPLTTPIVASSRYSVASRTEDNNHDQQAKNGFTLQQTTSPALVTIRGVYDGKEFRALPTESLPLVYRATSVLIVFLGPE